MTVAIGPSPKREGEFEEYVKTMGDDSKRNTSIADYVWLPLRFEGDMVYIDWKDEWKIEDYAC